MIIEVVPYGKDDAASNKANTIAHLEQSGGAVPGGAEFSFGMVKGICIDPPNEFVFETIT